MAQRSRRHPYLGLFDGANPSASVAQRESSVTPLQALYFMNAEFPKECAAALAQQLHPPPSSEPPPGSKPEPEKEEIRAAFLRIYGRPPDPQEMETAARFLQETATIYLAHDPGDADRSKVQAQAHTQTHEGAHTRALSNLIQALYASNEFMFID